MAHDDEPVNRDALRETFREQATIAVSEMAEEQPNPSGKLKHRAAVRLDDYRRQLLKYRNEKALKEEWSKRGVDVISTWLSETVTTQEPMNRRGNPTQNKKVPMVYEVDFRQILAAYQELEDIYTELGFSQDPDSHKDRFRVASPNDEDHPEPVNENVAKPGQ